MGYVCGYFLPNCGGGGSAITCLSYNSSTGKIQATHATNLQITIINSDDFKSKNFHFKLSAGAGSGGICNYSISLSPDTTYDVNAPISNTNISPATYKASIKPYLGNYNWYYAEYFAGDTPTYTLLTCGQSFAGFNDSVPIEPAVPTFTLANAYNGYDSVKICATSTTSNVQYWNVYKSTGGTYSFLSKIYASATTHCYYDNDITLGNTYYYYVSAVNEPWSVSASTQSIVAQSVIDDTCVIRPLATLTNVYSGDTTSTYELWRSTGETGTYERVGHVYTGGTQLYDLIAEYGETYWYKVLQITPNWSLWSSTAQQITTTLSMPLGQTLSGVINTGTTSVDLSWVDNNTYKQNYEIWRNRASAGYTLIDTVTGLTYHAIIDVGVVYDFKVRGKIDCFDPTFIYSPYSNELTYSITPVITPPTGLTATTVTCTGGTLTWVNTNISGQTGNYVRQWNGTGYTTIADIASGDTSYVLTGLTPFTSYSYIIVAYNIGREATSAGYTLTTLDPTPFNLNVTVTSLSAQINWSINDPPYGINIRPELRLSGTTNFTEHPLIAKNAVTHTFTGLSWNTSYEARYVRIGTEYPSPIIGFSTDNFIAPSDLTLVSIDFQSATLSWTNNTYNDSIKVYYNREGTGWVLYETLDPSATGTTVNYLLMNATYYFYVANENNGYELNSNQVEGVTPIAWLPQFCEIEDQFTSYDSSCGNTDGYFLLNNPNYMQIYDIRLFDYLGNIYTFNDDITSIDYGKSELLPSGWYRAEATVKPRFDNWYSDCNLRELQIVDADTSMTFSGATSKPAVCVGFGANNGRINWYSTDSVTGSTYTVRIFARTEIPWAEGQLMQETTGVTDITNFYYEPQKYSCFYGEIISDSGCKLLLPMVCVESLSQLNVEGINKLWVYKWNDSITYDYWSSSENYWNDPNVDPQYHTSLKLKQFNDLGDTWKSIPLDNAIVEADQKMVIGNVGFTFVDTLSITFNDYTNAKWNDLTEFYEKSYIIIYQDNNNAYHVMGYRHGSELSGSETAEGALKLTFTAVSEDKILPEIDEQYIIDEVIPNEEEIFTGCTFSVLGVKNVYIAGYQTNGELIDFPLEFTVASGSTESIIEVEWDEDNLTATIGEQELALRKISDYGEGALSFNETFEKNNAGREFVKKLSVKIPNINLFSTTAIKQYLFSITQEFKLTNNVLFLTDYNDNMWIIGYDNPVKMTSMGITITGNNEYALDFESRSPRRSRNFIKT